MRVAGAVLHDDGLQRREFALLRYSIVHCVADARPVVLRVIAPGDTAPPEDSWVQVEGVLSSRDYRGGRLVTIAADRILPAAEPQDPYLRGGF